MTSIRAAHPRRRIDTPVDAFYAAIENMALARFLRASFIAYPLINALHIAAIGAVFGSLIFLHGRWLGLFPALASSAARDTFRKVAFLAFAIAVLTGVLLFSVKPAEYAANPAFQIKLLLIAGAGLNLALYSALPRWRAAGTIISLLLWSAIIVAGRYIGFV